MSNKNSCQIYALAGLTPEVRAVTFAKCLRSDKSFKEIAASLTAENSSRFHENGLSVMAIHQCRTCSNFNAMENISL